MRTGGVHYLFAKASTPTGNQNLSKVAAAVVEVVMMTTTPNIVRLEAPQQSQYAHLESELGGDARSGALGALVLLALSDGLCAAHRRD